ncbi:MAG: carboxypeptidase-like regulatory domain-containing protein, partial [Chloroflexi bacterium]|nr:carboxypeptidase-like regulatory domain-containing protein [Chloroflexota bacterium]
MKLRACMSLLLAMIACGAPTFAVNPLRSAVATTDGSLVLSVVVVDDLVPRPVPLTDFTITDELGGSRTVRTDAEGTFQGRLSPGRYTIESRRPVTLKSRLLTWKSEFKILAGETTKLDLT